MNGKMAEWVIAPVLKIDKVNSFQGSNPCLSSKIYLSILELEIIEIKKELNFILFSKMHNLHIDIMNESYVNNNYYTKNICKKIIFYLKKIKKIKFEIHIMSFNKIKIFKSNILHLENSNFLIKKKLALTHNFCNNYIKNLKNKILIMSVNPGFGGQKFLKKNLKNKKFNSVDGGININIYKFIKKKFNKIIIGSKIIKKKNYLSYFKYNYIFNEFKIC